jgi:YidC/Oxa1 family membrane protein insertase
LFDIFGFLWQGFWHFLLNVLVAINSVVGSAGISIIIFTILMRMLTVPFTLKSLRSSRNMQAVQPLIKEVQKKHGKDRAKAQEETMKIYRDYGINPAAGCFPMLLQLPIFFGLFAALSFVLPTVNPGVEWAKNQAQLASFIWNPAWIGEGNASDFRQSFGWVTNLGAHDPLYIWPVLSGIFQFIQSRMAMPKRDPNNPMDPQQRMMNNIMQFMPIYIVFISAGFPAGTVIYWAFSSLFGATLQYFITGFGSLPDMPGLKWLPHKELVRPAPLDPSLVEANSAKRKTGMFGKMMEKALEAQEAQRNAQAAPATASAAADADVPVQKSASSSARKAPTRSTATTATTAKTRSIVSKAIESSNGSEGGAQSAYASDRRREASADSAGTTGLPRKRKNKK